jgi:Uma2 family endonuclease
MTIELRRYRFNVEQYHKLGEIGLFAEGDRIELIDGDLALMSPRSTHHIACVINLGALLVMAFLETGVVSVQNPIRLNDFTEPLPDFAVFRPQPHGYRESMPTGRDTLLVIEVADSTVRYDRNIKLPRYAEAGVPEVWIVDLQANEIEISWAARGRRYTSSRVYLPGQVVESPTVSELRLDVDAILV